MITSKSIVAAVKGGTIRTLMAFPQPMLRRMAGKPITIDGKTLDPQVQLMLRLEKLEGPPVETLSIERGRKQLASSAQLAGGRQPIGAVADRTIAGPGGPLPLRIYTPSGVHGNIPGLFFIHGGGWIYGDLESHDATCRFLAEKARVRVIAVDYRLAPEAPFPAAFDDTVAAWKWIVDNAEGVGVDVDRLAIGGDSAGGNLATIIAQHAVREGFQAPKFQLLIYPATDFVDRAQSRDTFAEGFYLSKAFMDLAEANYLRVDEDRADRRLSPLGQDVAGIAPAYVVTAGFDPLLDEGKAYADKLRAAGVEVEYRCEESLIHGFANLIGVNSASRTAMAHAAAALEHALA